MLARTSAVLAGAGLYTLALPPFDLGACAWLTLVPLLLVLHGASARAGLGWGLLYGCAFGWGATWWSVQAVTRYFALPTPLSIAGLSVFYVLIFLPAFGLFGAGTALLLRRNRGTAGVVAVAALWAASELVRARAVGQPWGLLGYSQHDQTALIQITALTGVYGLSFLLALGNAALAAALQALRSGRRRSAARLVAGPGALIAAVWIGGALVVPGAEPSGDQHSIAVVQTAVPPAYEWTRAYAERQLRAHIQATDALPATARPALVIWPENAVTQHLESDPGVAEALAALARRRGADLLFGAPRHEDGHTYNSVRLMTADGRYGGHYDKQHLVLLAEAGLLTSPTPSAPSTSPRVFTPGRGPALLESFAPLGISICHEVVYPELVTRAVRAGAELLVNVSNDGWLDAGHGTASRQHFAMATLRAVESRRYLVRAATTGVSGVVDPWGRVLAELPPGVRGAVTVSVQARHALTPYARFGDVFALACLLVACTALGSEARRLRIGLLRAERPWRRLPAPTA